MRVGVVLSGGMAKGAYQVGALKAISGFFPPSEISYFSCSSVGVLNGYAYAAKTLDKAQNIWETLCNNQNRILINQLLRSSLLQDKITEIYNSEFTITIPFYCTLADLSTKSVVYKDLSAVQPEALLPYLKASVAMPVYNKAVRIDNKLYFDGAMLDNIPVFPLQKKPLDYLICVYFDNISYRFENPIFDSRVIKIHFPTKSVIKQSLIFRQDSILDMIQAGYDRTAFILNTVFSKGTDNLDAVYHAIDTLNRYTEKSTLRVTGDMLVTNLNKAAKRLLKQKIS